MNRTNDIDVEQYGKKCPFCEISQGAWDKFNELKKEEKDLLSNTELSNADKQAKLDEIASCKYLCIPAICKNCLIISLTYEFRNSDDVTDPQEIN